MSSLTVFSRISNHNFRFWAITIIIYCLNLDLKGHVGGSSRHDEFWNVGHSLWGPVLIHIFLSPLDSVLQAGPIGLISCQWLHREHYRSSWHRNITAALAKPLFLMLWFQMEELYGLLSRRRPCCQALFRCLEHLQGFHQELGKPKHAGSVSAFLVFFCFFLTLQFFPARVWLCSSPAGLVLYWLEGSLGWL